jgi:hypothetical protein
VVGVYEHDRAAPWDELDVERMAPAAVRERRVREVFVARHVVRLVLEPERNRIKLAAHGRPREAGHGLVPPRERVVVVEPEAMAPRRAVRRDADDLDSTLA